MFDPKDWYWTAEDGRIFSSAREAIVEDDAEFLEWAALGNAPTPWPRDDNGVQSEAALDAVLLPYGIHTSLAVLKAETIVRINEAAERCRGKYITPGDGQMMTYLEKITQARACLAVQSPKAADYPMLAAEIGITAPTLVGVAEIVVAAYNQWLIIGSAIEATRRAANVAVEAATTRATVQAVLDGLVFPEGASA
ncbi:hypothetical protein D3C80_1124540 [compost metagenome]